MKVLMVRLSAIGDVVHTLPTLAALHAAGHEVSWLVEPAASPLLLGQPKIASVVVGPSARRFKLGRAFEAARALRAQRFDLALDLQGLWKSAAWARAAGARRAVGAERRVRREMASSLLLHAETPIPTRAVHVIDKNLALLSALGLDAIGGREFPLPEAPAAVAGVEKGLGSRARQALALLNPGGGWANKLWPPESYGQLARRLRERGLLPLVTWGPGEGELAARVAAASEGAAEVAFPTTLLEFTELARRARVVVAGDTGPLHLACAVRTPVVALFGPTDPARNGPFAAEDIVVRRAPACAPCHRRRCVVHDDVMKFIGVDEVFRAVEARLVRASRPSMAAVEPA
jgi:lipopolysaccharide heptosyltransferase I